MLATQPPVAWEVKAAIPGRPIFFLGCAVALEITCICYMLASFSLPALPTLSCSSSSVCSFDSYSVAIDAGEDV